jgi:vacuolar protein sorting-associated protein 13A/C
MKIHRLQIDNQMSDCIFGIVMCPVAPPKSIAADQMPRSFIELSTVIQRQATMNRFKYSSILIQEFLIQIDRGLLLSLQELFEVAVKKQNNKQLITKDLRDIFKVLPVNMF